MAQNDGVYTFPPPYAVAESSSGDRISPTVLIIIVVLAFLFFISGVLHLLVKYLMRHRSPLGEFGDEDNEILESNVLQRQLQELFHLHDCGLDQSVIDELPVFVYNDITGPKEPYDCAVCLCEFKDDDKLRLLPTCSHAFHTGCIDTWLLSCSTCPVCRNALFAAGFSVNNPIFEFGEFGEDEGYSNSGHKNLDVEQQVAADEVGNEQIPLRLGKFKRLDEQISAHEAGSEETSCSNFDGRRCYSMGSYQYIVGETSLHISLSGDRHTRNEIFFRTNNQEFEDSSSSFNDTESRKICNAAKGESLSVSKIWMWPKENRFGGSSDTEMEL